MSSDLRRVLDAVLDGVVVLDRGGRVVQVNDEAARVLGSSAEGLAGVAVEEVLGEEHALARLARAALGSGRAAVESEVAVEQRFAPASVVDVAASPLVDEAGRVDGAVLVLRDRTIQSALQEMVAERERLEAFGRIAAGIAHEVKNPLGGIRGAAEILGRRAGESDERARGLADLIVREVDRIGGLVEDLMVFGRGEKLSLGAVNIHQVLDDVLELIGHEPAAKRVRVERLYDPSIPELKADRKRLVQVFLNLARNAVQAMEAGGTLTITTRMSFEQPLPRRGGRSAAAVAVEVADTGPGIPPELVEKVGTPFYTTRTGGTGLGLPVAEHWVARHGGSLRIESRSGAGTRVRVTLPLAQEASRE